MFAACLLEELSTWFEGKPRNVSRNEYQSRSANGPGRGPLPFIACAAIALTFVTFAHSFALAYFVIAVSFWLGWREQFRAKAESGLVERIGMKRAPPSSALGAAQLASLAVWASGMIATAPALVILAMARGLPLPVIAALLATGFACFAAASAIALVLEFLVSVDEGFIAAFLLFAWLAVGLFVPALAPSSVLRATRDLLEGASPIATAVRTLPLLAGGICLHALAHAAAAIRKSRYHV